MRFVECWVPKLATEANGAGFCTVAITAARYKPDPSRDKNLQSQPTTPVRTPHSSVDGPFCCSWASLCEGNTTAQPTQSVLTERLPLRIMVASHCISRGIDICTIRDSGASTKDYKSNAALAALLTVEIFWSVQEVQVVCSTSADNER